jgi:hypothetical protein
MSNISLGVIEDYFSKALPAKDFSHIYTRNDRELKELIEKDMESRYTKVARKFKYAALGIFRREKIMPLEDVAEALCSVGVAKDIPDGIALAKKFSGNEIVYDHIPCWPMGLFFDELKNGLGDVKYKIKLGTPVKTAASD